MNLCLPTYYFPETVLVIEYGEIEDTRGIFDPPDQWETSVPGAGSWDFYSLPNPAMGNQTAYIKVGKTVGGGSAVNGQFFDRGSRYDYDAWEEVYGKSGKGPGDIKWDWKGIFPYFKKVRLDCFSCVLSPRPLHPLLPRVIKYRTSFPRITRPPTYLPTHSITTYRVTTVSNSPT